MDMLNKIKDMAKSMYDNGIYVYVPDFKMIIDKDENGIYDVITLEIENFEGKGDTIEKAFKNLCKDYKKYIKDETEFEDEMMSYFEDLNV